MTEFEEVLVVIKLVVEEPKELRKLKPVAPAHLRNYAGAQVC